MLPTRVKCRKCGRYYIIQPSMCILDMPKGVSIKTKKTCGRCNEKLTKEEIESIKKQDEKRKQETIKRLKNSYCCKHKCLFLDPEQAKDFEYKCPECGLPLKKYNKGTI